MVGTDLTSTSGPKTPFYIFCH